MGGSTEKLAKRIEENLIGKGCEVDVERIEPKKKRSFLSWFVLRIFRSEVDIKTPKIRDASTYDAVVFGSPNWTKISLPMRRYISEIDGLKGKNVGFFSTTALWPSFEWHIFSAYLLFSTFIGSINKRGGKVIDFILLSSLIKKEGIDSEWGKAKIDDFCKKIVTQEKQFKEDIIKRREIEDAHFLKVFFSTIIFVSIIFQGLASDPLDWSRYGMILLILVIATGLITHTIEKKRDPAFIKFMAPIVLVSTWTILLTSISGDIHNIALIGYMIIFIFVTFLKNMEVVLTAGLASILGYFYIYVFHPNIYGFYSSTDIILLSLVLAVSVFTAYNIQKHFIAFAEAQEDIEMARMVLEVKVQARTKELQEFNRNLEKMVEERTKDLENKIDELERFNRLTVRRELRMMELKKRLKELEKK